MKRQRMENIEKKKRHTGYNENFSFVYKFKKRYDRMG
jgi:hypothetical protein